MVFFRWFVGMRRVGLFSIAQRPSADMPMSGRPCFGKVALEDGKERVQGTAFGHFCRSKSSKVEDVCLWES